MADARRVSVRLVDDQLKLTPQRNLGAKNGFEAIPDEAELVPVNDWSTAAVTLLRLLSASDD